MIFVKPIQILWWSGVEASRVYVLFHTGDLMIQNSVASNDIRLFIYVTPDLISVIVRAPGTKCWKLKLSLIREFISETFCLVTFWLYLWNGTVPNMWWWLCRTTRNYVFCFPAYFYMFLSNSFVLAKLEHV